VFKIRATENVRKEITLNVLGLAQSRRWIHYPSHRRTSHSDVNVPHDYSCDSCKQVVGRLGSFAISLHIQTPIEPFIIFLAGYPFLSHKTLHLRITHRSTVFADITAEVAQGGIRIAEIFRYRGMSTCIRVFTVIHERLETLQPTR